MSIPVWLHILNASNFLFGHHTGDGVIDWQFWHSLTTFLTAAFDTVESICLAKYRVRLILVCLHCLCTDLIHSGLHLLTNVALASFTGSLSFLNASSHLVCLLGSGETLLISTYNSYLVINFSSFKWSFCVYAGLSWKCIWYLSRDTCIVINRCSPVVFHWRPKSTSFSKASNSAILFSVCNHMHPPLFPNLTQGPLQLQGSSCLLTFLICVCQHTIYPHIGSSCSILVVISMILFLRRVGGYQ